jgi:hypothetical protein
MAATWVSMIILVSRLASGGAPIGQIVPVVAVRPHSVQQGAVPGGGQAAVQAARQKPRENVGGLLLSGSMRAFSSAGKDYVVIDAPRFDGMLRLGDKPIFLTLPVAFSWGVKGGFTSELSVGVGLSWAPSKYVAAYAQQRLGSFFFNHGVYQRSVGLDINIPISDETFVDGVTRQNLYLVIGAEYFYRDVHKWLGFMAREQWYASGHGVALRVGVRRLVWF